MSRNIQRFLTLFVLCFLLLMQSQVVLAEVMLPAQAFLQPVPVNLLEDHHEALSVWVRQGARKATVVHIDSHHDLLSKRVATDWTLLKKKINSSNQQELLRLGDARVPGNIYDLGSYLVPAWDLGLIDEIWWVYPHAQVFDTRFLLQMKEYLSLQQMGVFSKDEIAGWHLSGPFIKGTLRDIPVTLSRLEDLPKFSQPVLLDIDCDYFVGDSGLPAAFNLTSRFMQDRFNHFRTLIQQKQLPVQTVTIAHSVAGDYLPVRFRYLGRLLAESLGEPASLDELKTVPWQKFWSGEAAYEQRDYATARTAFKSVAQQPHWLADNARYYLALISALQGDMPGAVSMIKELGARNQLFTWGVFDIGGIAKRQQKFADAEHLFGWATELGGRWSYEGRMELGRLYAETGHHPEAVLQFRAASETLPHMSLPKGLLAAALMKLFRYPEAYVVYRSIWTEGDGHLEYEDRSYLPNLIKTAILAGDRKFAVSVMTRLEQIDADNPEILTLQTMLIQR